MYGVLLSLCNSGHVLLRYYLPFAYYSPRTTYPLLLTSPLLLAPDVLCTGSTDVPLTLCYPGHSILAHVLGPRFFCVDMGGWAFDAALLQGFKGVPWSYPGRRPRAGGAKSNVTVWRGGESEFLQQLLGPHAYPEDLQPLANCAHDVLVIHNAADLPKAQWRAHTFVRAARPVFCRTDGW